MLASRSAFSTCLGTHQSGRGVEIQAVPITMGTAMKKYPMAPREHGTVIWWNYREVLGILEEYFEPLRVLAPGLPVRYFPHQYTNFLLKMSNHE